MLIAKINDGVVGEIGKPGEIFPNVAFPVNGPTQDFLQENSCLEINLWKSYNSITEKLVSCDPYIENNWVYLVTVENKTQEELDIDIQLKNSQLQETVVNSTQNRLDTFARTKNYDGIMSACTYVTDPSLIFSAEGQRAVELRSATWSKLYEILAEVQAGIRPVPTSFLDIEPELPTLSWN